MSRFNTCLLGDLRDVLALVAGDAGPLSEEERGALLINLTNRVDVLEKNVWRHEEELARRESDDALLAHSVCRAEEGPDHD